MSSKPCQAYIGIAQLGKAGRFFLMMGVKRAIETCAEMYNYVNGGIEDQGDLHRDVQLCIWEYTGPLRLVQICMTMSMRYRGPLRLVQMYNYAHGSIKAYGDLHRDIQPCA